ncbi:DUF2849 domain-containing protein [Agrobacterium tumefaciens]|uniref:DUF2849 domain-containing protein n=1 Tax=Agrobacterium tumefaciens TaxID=358 RepID=UPI00287E0F63|nr:DUF2849 domain-containing protein [Agrobacterium tumefaciens]MDS7596950.1 DUF2849 domain-containing protein [Agrobacterium tumefaciens]
MAEKVLTANRLDDGIAVWLDANGEWTENLQNSLVARHAEAVASLEEIGKRDFSANKVVDVNLVDVVEENGRLWPTRLRERIRAAGPTVQYATGFKPADAAFIAV